MPENGSGVVVCSSSLLLCSHPGRRQAETPLIQPVQKSRASSEHLKPTLGYKAGLLQQLLTGCLKRIGVERPSSSDQLPRVHAGDIAVLADQISAPILVYRQHCDAKHSKAERRVGVDPTGPMLNLILFNVYIEAVVEVLGGERCPRIALIRHGVEGP